MPHWLWKLETLHGAFASVCAGLSIEAPMFGPVMLKSTPVPSETGFELLSVMTAAITVVSVVSAFKPAQGANNDSVKFAGAPGVPTGVGVKVSVGVALSVAVGGIVAVGVSVGTGIVGVAPGPGVPPKHFEVSNLQSLVQSNVPPPGNPCVAHVSPRRSWVSHCSAPRATPLPQNVLIVTVPVTEAPWASVTRKFDSPDSTPPTMKRIDWPLSAQTWAGVGEPSLQSASCWQRGAGR